MRARSRRSILVLVLTGLLATVASAPATSQTPAGVVVLDGGEVIIDLDSLAPSDCPIDYVCLWEHVDFTGSMVAFTSCCVWYNLADYGFNNRMSSWRNRKAVDAKAADFQDGNGDRWCLNEFSQNGSVNWNDRATSLRIFTSASAC